MPFLSEEIWQIIEKRSPEEALIVSSWPATEKYDEELLKDFELIKEVISNIRNIRKTKNISFRNKIDLKVIEQENAAVAFEEIILKLGNINEIIRVENSPSNAISFRIK